MATSSVEEVQGEQPGGVQSGVGGHRKGGGEVVRLTVEIKWKGPMLALSLLRTSLKRNFTREEEVEAHQNGIIVEWLRSFRPSVLSLPTRTKGLKLLVPLLDNAVLVGLQL